MLSKKMTFSLMSLITLIAFAFVAGDAFAAEKPFEIKIMGRASVTYTADDPDTTDVLESSTPVTVKLKVESAQPIGDLTFNQPFAGTVPDGEVIVGPGDINVAAFDKYDNLLFAGTYGKEPVDAVGETPAMLQAAGVEAAYVIMIIDDRDYAMRDAKNHQLLVTITPQKSDADLLIAKVVISLPAVETNDPTVLATDGTDTKLNESKLVQHTITLSEAVSTVGLPKVVSIQRLRPGSQTVVSAFQEERIVAAPFNVRIVLTELPNGIDLADVNNLVEVENGTVSNLVIGTLFSRFGAVSGNLGVDAGDEQDGTGRPAVEANAAIPWQTVRPHPGEGDYNFDNDYLPLQGVELISTDVSDTVPMPTGDDNMYRQYRVTITPHQKSADFDVKVRIKTFHDNGAQVRNTYVPPGFGDSAFLPNGRDILTVPVKGAARDLTAGYRVTIPKEKVIPAGGYLVIAQNAAGSEVVVPPGKQNEAPKATERTPAQMLYNVIGVGELPNLATQFRNGVVVDVESQHPLVISEVMWGEDVSLDPSSNSQYIELYNPGAQYATVADADHTPDVNEALTLIFYAPNEFSAVPARDAAGALPTGVTDRIGTLDAKGTYWNPVGKGQSGRSGTTEGELTAGRGEFVDAVPIVSMYRVIEEGVGVLSATNVVVAFAAEFALDGQSAASWSTSAGPKSANFDPLAIGIRHGTPGAATDATTTPADTAAEKKAAADKAAAAVKKTESTGTIPEDGQIYISEVMFAGGGILPQWIEISNGSRTEEINLSGWTITVDNAAADADVSIGASAKFTIADGTTIDPSGQQDSASTILVVTEAGRNNVEDSGQVLDLMKSNEVDLILAGVVTRKYTLLSGMAFMVTLAPPEPEKTKPPTDETAGAKATRQAAEKKAANVRKAATDMAGNLGADGAAAWALPMDEDGRSSIIRRHVQVAIGAAAPDDGTLMDSWVLASDTGFAAPTHLRTVTYYGAQSDTGTPGFRAGGALPVELSQFRPARDKVTGAVVITWSTQSELNNAGFFIKRSQQRDGEFQVINATMIAKVQARPVRSSSIRITIQLLNPMSYTTTKLKMYLLMGIVRH